MTNEELAEIDHMEEVLQAAAPLVRDHAIRISYADYVRVINPASVLRLIAAIRACGEEKEHLRRERRFAFKQVDDLTAEVERLRSEVQRLDTECNLRMMAAERDV